LTDHAPDLAVAIELANAAGEIVRRHFRRLEHVQRKGPGDVVTEVDYLAEALILAGIRAAFPTDRVVAEESGNHPAASGPDREPRPDRTWFVDPLDGTVNYAHGIPFCSVSIGLVVAGRPAVGVVLDPIGNELFSAVADGRAELNGQEICAATEVQPADLLVSSDAAPRGRLLGSAALELCYVAAGRLDAFVQSGHLSNWDVAAAGLIAERAGASLSLVPDGPWFELERAPGFGLTVASPGYLRRGA
jgi:fructose-1,6-bisphosphatase/inositol monophosphatase family enzyme